MPLAQQCAVDGRNLGDCLGARIFGAAPVVVIPEEQVASPAVTAEPDLAVADPREEAAATPVDPVVPEQEEAAATAPSFDLVRVEPDGAVVIAGQAEPGAVVTVLENGEPIGVAEASPQGEWVLVPDAPLSAGGVELTAEAPDAAGGILPSEQSVVVLIDPETAEMPIVIASTPGAASNILQGLAPVARAPAQPEMEIASVPEDTIEPVPEPAVAPRTTASIAQPTLTPDAPVSIPSAPSTEPPETPAIALPAEISEIPAGPVPAPSVAATPSPALPSSPPERAPALVPALPTVAPPSVEQPNIEIAALPEAAPEEAEPAPQIDLQLQPSIDAIEIDGELNFFAGAGPEGRTVRLYVDNVFVADSVVEDGRWLVETSNVLTRREQRVRADVLSLSGANVEARAEVNFVIEDFESEPATQIAVAPVPVNAAPAPPPPGQPVTRPAGAPTEVSPLVDAPSVPLASPVRQADAQPEQTPAPTEAPPLVVADVPPAVVAPMQVQPAQPVTAQPVAPAAEPAPAAVQSRPPSTASAPQGSVSIEPAPQVNAQLPPAQSVPQIASTPANAPPATAIPPLSSAASAGQSQPVESAQAAQAQTAQAPVAPAIEAPSITQLPRSAAAPSVSAAPLSPAEIAVAESMPPGFAPEPGVPTLVAVASADGQRLVAGKVIIRRGDNLWAIARRVYGAGIRYSVIFEANSSQIRNPHRIYPGQVFDLPAIPE